MDNPLIQGAQRIPSILAAFGLEDGTDDHLTSLNRGYSTFLLRSLGCPRGHNREAGVSPSWSRHCDQEKTLHQATRCEPGKAKSQKFCKMNFACQSGDLPKTICDSTPRGNGEERSII
jgi:hypothetical protein